MDALRAIAAWLDDLIQKLEKGEIGLTSLEAEFQRFVDSNPQRKELPEYKEVADK